MRSSRRWAAARQGWRVWKASWVSSIRPWPQAAQQICGGTAASGATVEPGQAGQRVVHRDQRLAERLQGRADMSGSLVQEFGEPVGERAPGAEPLGVQFAFGAAAGALVGDGEARAVRGDRGVVSRAEAGEGAVGIAAGAVSADAKGPVVAGAADVAVRPADRESAVTSAAGAIPHRVGGLHASRRMRAGRGRSFAAAVVGAGRSPLAVLRTPAFSAVVATRSAGVQEKMSQSAART